MTRPKDVPENVVDIRYVHEKCGKPYREHKKLFKIVRGKRKVVGWICPGKTHTAI